jgi:hypothetical protein
MVFCDTEEEFDWSKPHNRGNRSTSHMKTMPEAQRRLADMGAHPDLSDRSSDRDGPASIAIPRSAPGARGMRHRHSASSLGEPAFR